VRLKEWTRLIQQKEEYPNGVPMVESGVVVGWYACDFGMEGAPPFCLRWKER
jgi:hypothetical protein